ncbi:MAG: OmpA family protein [Bacteroidota bacterium]
MNKTSYAFSLLCLAFVTACTFVQKVRDGQTAYDRKQYSVAAEMLPKDYKKAKSRVEKGKIAFMLGESYKRMNRSDKSIDWYLNAYNNSYGVDALREYAYALKRSGQYEEAKQAFKNLGIEIGSPYEYRREITACTQALEWVEESKDSDYSLELLPFNSGNSDYSPTIYKDGQLLITSDRSSSTGDDTYNWTGNKFSDIFQVNPGNSDISPFDGTINTTNNEGTIAFNEDFTEMVFTRCYNDDKYSDNYCKLMSSRFEDGAWTKAEPLNFVQDKINYGHPSLSKDGSTLYFSSDNNEGWGGFDIYVTERVPDGWEQPQLLSRSINTSGNEKFPTIDADTLYFSSDYHTGMGGLDVFRSYKMGNGNWSPVKNLKPPVNSAEDDFGLVIDYNAPEKDGILQTGYVSSTRQNGAGNDDIYRFERRIPPPPPPVDTTKAIVYKLLLDVYVLEKIYQFADNPNSKVLGRKPLGGADLVIDVPGKRPQIIQINEEGLYELELSDDTDYKFSATKDGYLRGTGAFSSKGIGKDPNNPVLKFELEIVLDKIFANTEIVLENIYYDFDKYFIREDAIPTLNELTSMLEQNPEIRIQLSSHTDCQGNGRYNQTLSQRRAQSAVDFLISQGIDPVRLEAVGYGENALLIECVCSRCTDEEHQANRRTTFKILQ